MVSWQNKAVAHGLRRPNCALCDCTRTMDPRIEHKPFVCLLHQRQAGAHYYHGIFAIHREASEHPRIGLPVQWRAATHGETPLWCSVESVLLRDTCQSRYSATGLLLLVWITPPRRNVLYSHTRAIGTVRRIVGQWSTLPLVARYIRLPQSPISDIRNAYPMSESGWARV